jgi:hypothetical protein
VKDDTLCAIVELNLKVLLEDLANNCVCDEADLCILWFGNDWVFGLYQRTFGRKDDSSPRRIYDENLSGKSEQRGQSMDNVCVHGT